jgi:hypothetical protein
LVYKRGKNAFASSVLAAMRAIANCGLSSYAALTVQAEKLLHMSNSIHGERTASEPRDRVTELIEQQTAISEVLHAIASSPHDLQPIFDAILDSATRLCRADIGTLRVSEESGLRLVAVRGAPFWLVRCGHHTQCSHNGGAFRVD